MPLLLVATFLAQLLLIIHVVKTGRNSLWIMALFFFPVIGALAYFIVEIMPGLGNDRRVRAAKAHVGHLLDPARELRRTTEALAVVDTPANRTDHGDALVALGRSGEAIPHYRKAIENRPDAAISTKLARALLETGAAAEALDLLEGLPETMSIGERDRRALLKARIFDHLGRKSEAETIYADVVTRLPGEEARCRYAAVLLERGATVEARVVLEEVETRMKRLTRAQRAPAAAMYDWATVELARLRS